MHKLDIYRCDNLICFLFNNGYYKMVVIKGRVPAPLLVINRAVICNEKSTI